MTGASAVGKKIISAVKPKREGGHARAKKRRGGENVIWHRIVDNIDGIVRQYGKNPEAAGPLGRWYLFKHLTRVQVMAGSRYAGIMASFDRFHTDTKGRTTRSQSFEPSSSGADQEIERRERDGSIDDYERMARRAKRHYDRVMKILNNFADPVTGRNYVKDALDMLCCSQHEPAPEYRGQVAAVLSLIAKEFQIDGRTRRRIVSSTPMRKPFNRHKRNRRRKKEAEK